jgi:hypothetical protein
MSILDNIVDVQISKDTATVSRVGFGVPAVFSYHTAFPELAKAFGDLTEVVAPIGPFAATSREAAIATAIFAQNPKPRSIVFLRRATAPIRSVVVTPVTDATAGKPFALFEYSITLGDGVSTETFTFTTDVTPTVAEIVAGLESAINLGTVNVIVNDTPSVTDLTIQSADVPGGSITAAAPFTLEIDRTLFTQAEATPDAGVVADLAAARAVNDDWYALVSDATGPAEIAALATAVEALPKIYLAESADDDVPAVGGGDIATTLQSASLERTALMWHTKPHTSPAGAWVGKQLPTDPGSSTWKFKTLATILTDAFGSAEISTLDSKNANYYLDISGINQTVEGTMAGGEFIDVTRGIDWLTARLKENVFRVLAVNPKIPFTDLGIATIVNEVEGTLRLGVTNDLLATDPPFFVTFPRAADVQINDKANRLLPDIDFQATLAGAVHSVEIRGRVTV